MASIYDIIAPELAAQRKEGMALRSMAGQEKGLHKTIGQKTQDLSRMAFDIARERHPDLANSRERQNEFYDIVDHYLGQIQEQQGIAQESVTSAFGDAVEKGAALTPDVILPTKEQRRLIDLGKPWKRNEAQSRHELLLRLPEEQRAQAFQGVLTPDQQKLLDEIRAEEVQGPPEKTGGVLGSLWDVMTTGGRVAQAGIAGGIEELQKASAPEEPRQGPKVNLPTGYQPPFNLAELGSQAATGLGQLFSPVREAAQSFTEATGAQPMYGPEAATTGGKLLGLARLIGLPATLPYEVFLQSAQSLPGGKTVAGIPSEQAHETLKDPMKVGQIVAGALQSAGQAVDPNQAKQTRRVLQDIKVALGQEAFNEAIAELGKDAPKEELYSRTDQLLRQKVENDTLRWGVDHPNAAQLVLEVLAPEPVLSATVAAVGKVAKAGAAGVKAAHGASPFMQRATKAIVESKPYVGAMRGAEMLGEGFTFMPWTKQIAKFGPQGEAAAMRAKMAFDQSLAESQQFATGLGQNIARMERSLKDTVNKQTQGLVIPFSKKWQQKQELRTWYNSLLIDVIEDPAYARIVPEELRPALEAARSFQAKMQEFHAWGDTMKVWDPETSALVPKTLRELWMPHRVFEKGSKERFYRMFHPARRTQRVAGSFERTGAPIEKDPLKQYMTEVQQSLGKVRTGRQLSETHKAMLEKGVAIEVKTPQVAKFLKEEQHFAKLAKRIEKEIPKVERRADTVRLRAQNLEARIEAKKAGDLQSLQREFNRLHKRLGEAKEKMLRNEKVAQTEILRAQRTKEARRWGGGRAQQRFIGTRQEVKVLTRDLQAVASDIDTVKAGGIRSTIAQPLAELEGKHAELLAKHNALYDRKWALMHKAQASHGFALEARMRRTFGQETEEWLVKTKGELEAKTGVEHVLLESDMESTLQRITGQIGTIKGETLTMVPKPYADFLNTSLNIVKFGEAKGGNLAVRALSAFNRGLIQPWQRAWRSLHTIFVPIFHARNAAGGFGLSTIAHGLRALDPELQGKAVAAAMLGASGDAAALKIADGIEFTLRSGEKTTLGRVIKEANRLGVTGQLQHHIAAGDVVVPGTARGLARIPQALEQVAELSFLPQGARQVGKFISPAYWARATENYQHLVAFMGFLDNFTPDGMAKALELTSRFSGNYARLGAIEKSFMREAFGFYSWMRFIFPHIVRQTYENPNAMAAWIKARGYFERERGSAAPISRWGMPSWGAGLLQAAPRELQPPPQVGTHQFAVSALEDPWSMGMSFLPLALKVLGKGEAAGQDLAFYLGPLAQMATEVISGYDMRTGEPIDRPWIDFDSPRQFGHSRMGQAIYGLVERPTRAQQQLIQLYRQRPEQIDLATRFAVGRSWLGIDKIGAQLFGYEPRSIGGMFDWEGGGQLGFSQYLASPYVEGARLKRRAAEEFRGTERSLERATPGGI